jgi:crossover junction endodeoxyribonuclease RuvC
MFDRTVLGVDPGMATLGMAAVARGERRPAVAWAATLRTPSGLSDGARLRRVYAAVRQAIARHAPDAVAMERLMWGRNTASAMEVARASGAILLAAADAGLEVREYAPLEVKMAVAGVGNASKEQVRRALTLIHGAPAVPEQPDAADAVAIAVCHLQQSRMRRLAEEAVR